MAAKSTTKVPEPVTGFDITATIGRVEFTESGDESPFIVAFKVIGEASAGQAYGDVRTYRFDPTGRNRDFTEVTVKFPDSPAEIGDTAEGW